MTTPKDQLKKAAKNADLNPESALLLRNFFLKLATPQEKDELDKWLNEHEANSHLFDLLLEFNREGTGAVTLRLLHRYSKQPPRSSNKFNRFLWKAALAILVILFVDQLWPGHPLSRFIKGKPIREVSLRKLTIRSQDQSTIIMLSDSTLVELLPYSTLTYPEDFYLYDRIVKLKGSARFDIRKAPGEPFKVEGSISWVSAVDGEFIYKQPDSNQTTLITIRGLASISLDKNNTWAVEAGERAVYTGGSIKVEKMQPE